MNISTQKPPPVPVLKRWLPAILWAGFIFFVSHQPKATLAPIQPSGISAEPGITFLGIEADIIVGKSSHVLAFAILAALLYRATNNRWLTILLSLIYAISDEWHQSFIPGRTPRTTDVGYDMLGVGLALLFITCITLWKKRHPR